MHRHACLVLAVLALHSVARADPGPFSVTAFWENDGGFVKRNNVTDEHYTAGEMLLLSFVPDASDPNTAFGVFGAQQIFTPVDTSTTALIPDDRPYAGYLFVGGYWQRARDNHLDHVQLEVGALGAWSLGEDAQNWAHELIDDDKAMGWDNQVDNEITVQLTYRHKWRIDLLQQDEWAIDAIPGVGVGLGTFKRQVEGDAVLRAGWNLPDDFGPTRIDDLAGGPPVAANGFSAYAYARLGGRAVQHDATIDGPDFRSGPDTNVESAPFVGEFEAGFNLRYRHDAWALDFGYAQVFNTGEYKHQPGGDERAGVRLALICGF